LSGAAQELVVLDDGGISSMDQIPSGECLVDVTGMTKRRSYELVRGLLLRDRSVLIAYTAAATSFPLETDVADRFALGGEDDYSRLAGFGGLLTGEQGPYAYTPLQPPLADDGRRRMLLASATARHERLLSLLEQRDYDHLEVLTLAGDDSRSRLASLAARVAGQEVPSSLTHELAALSIQQTLLAIGESYRRNYSRGNFSFEVGLTGPKLHAVALSAASTVLKFSQAWYVHPSTFDVDRFTLGAGETALFRVSV
jgi:hypothetical protein